MSNFTWVAIAVFLLLHGYSHNHFWMGCFASFALGMYLINALHMWANSAEKKS